MLLTSIGKLVMSLKAPTDPLITIVGATGTGKSKLAIELAKRFDGEVINGDAMQMYKGLPIITNKVSQAEKQDVPHHIFDQIGLDEQPWTVSNFRREAHKTIREIRSRGRLPILVGGTHYYTKAVLFNDSLLCEEDASSASEEDTRHTFPILDAPTSEILARLREVDPKTASRWHPLDRRKIQRSLEIWLQTGKTASQTYAEQSERRINLCKDEQTASSNSSAAYSSLIFWLRSQDDVLKKRLDARVDTMLSSGLIEEAQSMASYAHTLTTSGLTIDKSKGIWASIGYKELEPYLSALAANADTTQSSPPPPPTPEALETTQSKCIASIKSSTRQYARRQDRWIFTHISSALTESNQMSTLYPLDSTHPSEWHAQISHPTTTITEHFLSGSDTRPPPESLSEMARETLAGIKAELEQSSTRECRYCEACDKTLMTEKEWTRHLAGNTHKKVLAGRRKWEALKAWEARQAAAGGVGEKLEG